MHTIIPVKFNKHLMELIYKSQKWTTNYVDLDVLCPFLVVEPNNVLSWLNSNYTYNNGKVYRNGLTEAYNGDYQVISVEQYLKSLNPLKFDDLEMNKCYHIYDSCGESWGVFKRCDTDNDSCGVFLSGQFANTDWPFALTVCLRNFTFKEVELEFKECYA